MLAFCAASIIKLAWLADSLSGPGGTGPRTLCSKCGSKRSSEKRRDDQRRRRSGICEVKQEAGSLQPQVMGLPWLLTPGGLLSGGMQLLLASKNFIACYGAL